MKRITAIVLALILIFTLASCTRPVSAPSSVPVNMADISTPALDGKPYTVYGIQFEANESWKIFEMDGATAVFFNNSLMCYFVFTDPEGIGAGTLSRKGVESVVAGFCETFGSNAVAGTISEVIVNEKKFWTVNVSSTLEGQQVEATVWLYGDDTAWYAFAFVAIPEDYETYLPYAQALLKSIKLP